MTQASLSSTLHVGGNPLRVLGLGFVRSLDSVDTALCRVDATEEELDDVQTFVGEAGTLVVQNTVTKSELVFAGEVIRATDRFDETGSRFVELVVASPLWRLTRTRQSRIFQKWTIEKICTTVFTEAGVTNPLEWHGEAHTEEKVYVVQYDESDFDFVRRLLAEAGITFGYEASGKKHVFWFSDQPQKRKDEEPRELAFRTAFGDDPAEATVVDLSQEHGIRPDAAFVHAYDDRHASLPIEGKHKDGEGTSEIYAPLSRAKDPGLAQKAAERLVATYQGRKKSIRGQTRVHDLGVGRVIRVTDHPYGPLNGDFVVVAARHVASQNENFSKNQAHPTRASGLASVGFVEFTAVPVDVKLVPERIPDARRIPGIQTAITTGPAGEEIHTSEAGEVTFHPHWDRTGPRDENSSRFVRTSQLPTGGSMLLPRMGWEVVLAYEEGDADQPLVMSRLYNAEAMPPYPLPDGALRSSLQTNTTPGGGSSNELRMDDTKGSEQMMFNASRDMSVQVGNNTTQSVGNDLKVEVGANQSHTVIGSFKSTVGADQTIHVQGNQTTSITSLGVDDVQGAHSATISGNRIQMIGGDHRREVTGASTVDILGNSMCAVIGSVTLETEANYTHDVGAAQILVSASDRSFIVGGAHSETTGGAKVLVAGGVRSLEVGSLAQTVGGAFVAQVKGSRTDSADGGWTETAGGMQKIEANNITLEAKMKIGLTMGGASITITPALVTISGSNVTIDGALVEMAPMIVDN